jgi:hypothetical protein
VLKGGYDIDNANLSTLDRSRAHFRINDTASCPIGSNNDQFASTTIRVIFHSRRDKYFTVWVFRKMYIGASGFPPQQTLVVE